MIYIRTGIMRLVSACIGSLIGFAWASGQATLPQIELKTVAEVEINVIEDGREVVHLSPANRVAPGDLVLYTVEIHNTGATDAVAPVVTRPIPAHMAYVADSAVGPGADISFSADGGVVFDRPENIKAKPNEYTHIRWKLKNTLKAKSVAFARFRAVVK